MGLAAAGLALSAIGTIGGVAGQLQQASAAKASANYQSEVAAGNAQIAKQNASYAANEGEAEAAQKQQQTRSQEGAILAGQASSGVDVNSPTSKDIRVSEAELGKLDANTIKSNAARRAYGFETEANNFENQGSADKASAKNAETSGYIGAGSSLLNGAGNAALNYSNAMRYGSGLSDAGNYVNASKEDQVAYDVAAE